MADKKVRLTELPQATEIRDEAIILISQGGVDYKAPAEMILRSDNNLSEVDPIVARLNLNVYSKEDVDSISDDYKKIVAIKFSVNNSQVKESKDGGDLFGFKAIYDNESKRSYSLPSNINEGDVIISLSGGILTTTSGEFDLAALAATRDEWVKITESFDSGFTLKESNEIVYSGSGFYQWMGDLPKIVPGGSTLSGTGGIGPGAWSAVGDIDLRSELASDSGYQLIPSIQIQQWRAEGDIRGWGAVDGAFNDAAIESALASPAASVKLGGRGFVSKILNTINMRSNKVMHSGSINAQFASGTVQLNTGVLLADLTNARIIDVELTGTLDAGIKFYGGSNLVFDGVTVHDIGFSQLVGECGMGIWCGDYSNYRTTNGVLIQNCTMQNIGGAGVMRGDGILVFKADNVRIRHNRVLTTNRMGISIGSEVTNFTLNDNFISDTILASIDIEPDASYTASNGEIYKNRCTGFGSRYSFGTGGVGQLFGIDIHTNTRYVKAYNNTLSAGQYATQAFHLGSNADEIEITNNDVVGGAVVIPLFIRTFDGAGSKHVKINGNRAKGTCSSFAQISMSEHVYLSDNVFQGNGAASSYFLSVATTDGLNVMNNVSGNTTNFIVSGSTGAINNMKVMNNNASTLADGITITASGAVTGTIMTGNNFLCPAGSVGVRMAISGSGTISGINLRGNIIPLSTTKMVVPAAATGWDMYTLNSKFDVPTAYNGMHLFELAFNRVNQYFNGAWQY